MPRLVRSVLLGVVAAALGIWWLGRAYGIDAAELLGFVFASTAFVAAAIALAGGAAAIVVWLRRRARRANCARKGLNKTFPSAGHGCSAKIDGASR